MSHLFETCLARSLWPERCVMADRKVADPKGMTAVRKVTDLRGMMAVRKVTDQKDM